LDQVVTLLPSKYKVPSSNSYFYKIKTRYGVVMRAQRPLMKLLE
jgi:hypothetical protein